MIAAVAFNPVGAHELRWSPEQIAAMDQNLVVDALSKDSGPVSVGPAPPVQSRSVAVSLSPLVIRRE